MIMNLRKIPYELSMCKLNSSDDFNYNIDFFFAAKTDEEISLVCKTEDVPSGAICRDDGWRGFYFDEILDFSLIGILSKISTIMADNDIGIFAVSTFNTDYILVKSENFDKAVAVLELNGYTFAENNQ